jgi:hypothetical protein
VGAVAHVFDPLSVGLGDSFHICMVVTVCRRSVPCGSGCGEEDRSCLALAVQELLGSDCEQWRVHCILVFGLVQDSCPVVRDGLVRGSRALALAFRKLESEPRGARARRWCRATSHGR